VTVTTTETMQLDVHDEAMPTYAAVPDGVPRGGVVVVQEAFGLTPHIESICRRLAEVGYLTLAPALFHRSGSPVFDYDGGFEKLMPVMQELHVDGIRADLAAAFDKLESLGQASRSTGIVGFCMGGTIALAAGVDRELGAAVTFYGGGVVQGRFGYESLVDQAPNLQTPWLGLFGDLDQGIPPEQVEELRSAAGKAPVPTEVVRYPDAGHGFNCDDRDAYHQSSATDAWARTLDWFDQHLS
jgi:carboxymethylenebutenolidase